jgi:hypothetical protein
VRVAEKYLAWSDRDASGRSLISDAALIDQVALYWMTDSIGSAVRLYCDAAPARSAGTRVSVPTGYRARFLRFALPKLLYVLSPFYDPRTKRAPRGAAQLLDEIRPAA